LWFPLLLPSFDTQACSNRKTANVTSTCQPPGRPSKQGPPILVWKAESAKVQYLLDNTPGTAAEFINHNPANFSNLLDELKKYHYEVDSLILPISSHEVVERNIKAYKNCEILTLQYGILVNIFRFLHFSSGGSIFDISCNTFGRKVCI
jgi:hypothetical protein